MSLFSSLEDGEHNSSSFISSFELLVVAGDAPVVVPGLPIGRPGARLLGPQVLVGHALIGGMGRQHAQQALCWQTRRLFDEQDTHTDTHTHTRDPTWSETSGWT